MRWICINYTLPQIFHPDTFLSQNETITLPEYSLRPSRCMHRHHPLQHGRICYSIGTPIWLAYVPHNNTDEFDEISILHKNGYLINKPASFSDEGNSLAAARESARPYFGRRRRNRVRSCQEWSSHKSTRGIGVWISWGFEIVIGSKILSFMGQDVSSVSVDDVTNVITEASSPLDIIFVLTAAKQRRQQWKNRATYMGWTFSSL